MYISEFFTIREKRFIERFRDKNAVNASSAKTFSELNLNDSILIKKMVRKRIILNVGEEKYYLDEDAAEKFFRTRRKIFFLIYLILAVLILIFSMIKDI